MNDFSDWNRLDAAGFRVSMRRSVRRHALYMSVIGAVVVACGIGGRSAPLAAVGVVLLGTGVWNIARPSVHGLLVDGVAMILTGIFSCTAGLWTHESRASSVGKWILTGLLQMWWGARRLALYPTARRTVNDPQAIARLEVIVRELAKRSAKDDATVVEFRTGRYNHIRNRLGLYAEGVVGLLESQVVRLEKRTDIWIEAGGSSLLGRSLKVRIQMSDHHLTGNMSAEHFERFERWKLGMAQAGTVAA